MIHPRAPQAFTCLLWVLVLLAAENHSFSTQHATEQIVNKNFGASEIALSLVANQMAVLKMLNESSACSSREWQLKKMLELEVKAGELTNELQEVKEAALNEWQNVTSETLYKIKTIDEEATEDLQNLKTTALSELQSTKTTTLTELQNTKTATLTELQNTKTATLTELNTKKEAATQSLEQLKAAALNELQSMKAEIVAELEKQKKTRSKAYRKYVSEVTQPQAAAACEEQGGQLALPMNAEEEQHIRTSFFYLPDGSNSFWIRGTDQQEEGKWIDDLTGQSLPYTNFREGEPSNNRGEEHCISMTSPGGWNDLRCYAVANGYLCEFIF